MRAARILFAFLLCGRALPLNAQAIISPSFQGSAGSNGMSAGSQAMIFSAPQTGAAVIMAGPHAIHSGFFGFLSGFSNTATTAAGQPSALTLATPAGLATLTLPADSLPAGTIVTLQIPVGVPDGGAALSAVPTTAILIYSAFQPSTLVTLNISYAGVNTSGLVPDKFIVAHFDPAQNAWVTLASTVDSSNRTVRAQAPDFSLFQLMFPPTSSAATSVKAFPNPLRPAHGQTAMTFNGLPANSRIQIYTMKNVMIKELSADASGASSWDGTNQAGAAAVSGVYFVIAKAAGEARSLTVAIER
jgi:hypothetical protein